MARIKQTKAELKAQREALHRYQRFLPTLQLKKEQLQSEVRRIQSELQAVVRDRQRIWAEVDSWMALFSEQVGLEELIRIQQVHTSEVNIVGVPVRRFESIDFDHLVPDLERTPLWLDTGLDRVKELIQLHIQEELLREEEGILTRELRTATQRVNLFDKVKIPECRENIRIIRIALGEEQTAAVARAKIAKSKTQERETGA